ncbi:MAG: class I SAM-dependent methyltransferase [Myxococcota bacterium]
MAVERGFSDHYGTMAGKYADYRPNYPATLFERIAQAAPGRRRCWDCATGNGQAAVGLVAHFDEVIATDASAAQIAHAVSLDGVSYRCEPAEATSLLDASIDAVTVAAALHWLDRPKFFAEVRRVCRPGALIAIWTYTTRFEVSAVVDPVLEHYARDVLGPYWPPGSDVVANGYRDVELPFDELPSPALAIREPWTLHRLVGYLNTWSAAGRFRAALDRPATDAIVESLERAWGPADESREVVVPLTVRLARVSQR